MHQNNCWPAPTEDLTVFVVSAFLSLFHKLIIPFVLKFTEHKNSTLLLAFLLMVSSALSFEFYSYWDKQTPVEGSGYFDNVYQNEDKKI